MVLDRLLELNLCPSFLPWMPPFSNEAQCFYRSSLRPRPDKDHSWNGGDPREDRLGSLEREDSGSIARRGMGGMVEIC